MTCVLGSQGLVVTSTSGMSCCFATSLTPSGATWMICASKTCLFD